MYWNFGILKIIRPDCLLQVAHYANEGVFYIAEKIFMHCLHQISFLDIFLCSSLIEDVIDGFMFKHRRLD